MTIKGFLSKLVARKIVNQTKKWSKTPLETQQKVFKKLIKTAQKTIFGKEHKFNEIYSFEDFAKNVPIRDYEQIKSYIEQIINGQNNVLWNGKPLYLAKTSGTTSGTKYIPLTKESLPTHIKATRDAIFHYIHQTKKTDFIDGKMIFLQGSPKLEEKNGIKIGRLSGIVAHYVPKYLQKNRLPSYPTNCIEDWETKIQAIIQETLHQKMTLISGIPPWVQMYFEKINERTNKKISEVFKDFGLFIYGGVNYEPYRTKFENIIGKKIDSIELFPASEGFFAYQDSQIENGMLLLLDNGIFYEFVKVDEFYRENPKRYTIEEVEIGINYVMIISTNAGLWAYNLGDTIEFVSKDPHRIIVTGRIKHFISAFGEHVITKEVEQALRNTLHGTTISVNEFTIAPQVNPESGLPYHQWFIEFGTEPENIEELALKLDGEMRKQNSYYDDLISGNILRSLVITKVGHNGFQNYMKSIGKLGGQNKIPRLTNDRKIAEKLIKYIL